MRLHRVRRTLLDHAGWIVGLGVLLLVAVNTVMSQAVLRPIEPPCIGRHSSSNRGSSEFGCEDSGRNR